MFSRFALSNNDDLALLADNATNKNTKRSMKTWGNVYKQWAETRNVNTNIEMLNAVELDGVYFVVSSLRLENWMEMIMNLKVFV